MFKNFLTIACRNVVKYKSYSLVNIIGIVAFVFMRGWLQNFAYRIPISLGIFMIAGLLALTLAVLTVGFQSLKSATTDPVKSIRYE